MVFNGTSPSIPDRGTANLTEGTWGLDRGSLRSVEPAAGDRLDVSAWGDRRDWRGIRRGGGVHLVRHQASLRAAGAAAAADIRHSARREAARAAAGSIRLIGGTTFRGRRRRNRNAYSLSPRGWQRSGALTALFSHAVATKVGLRTPTALYATAYGEAAVTRIHRPYQTILGLSRWLGLPIQSPDVLGQEAAFTEAALSSGEEVVLILLRTPPHPGARSGHPHRRWHHHPRRVARRPIRRHLEVCDRP
jgi:hypothetical protein